MRYSLSDVRESLLQVTTDIYQRSNLCTVEGYYQEHPFRLTVVVEGLEYKPAEAVIRNDILHIPAEHITVLAVEFLRQMSAFVKHKS